MPSKKTGKILVEIWSKYCQIHSNVFDHLGKVFYAIFMSFWDKIHYANDFAHYIMRYKIQCQKIQTAKNRLKILEICKNVQS